MRGSNSTHEIVLRLLALLVLATTLTGCRQAPEPSAEAIKSQLISDIESRFEWTDVRLQETEPGYYTGTATIEGQYTVDVEVKKLDDGVEAKWSSADGKAGGKVVARW